MDSPDLLKQNFSVGGRKGTVLENRKKFKVLRLILHEPDLEPSSKLPAQAVVLNQISGFKMTLATIKLTHYIQS